MANKAKHAFGALENIDVALQEGKIDAYDILFVKDANGKPYVGWIDKDGNKVVVEDSAEFAELENQLATKANTSDVTELESEVEKKVDAATVQTMIEEYSKSSIEVVEF